MVEINISNRNGRALEYKVVDFLMSQNSMFKVTLKPQALRDQERDIVNYQDIPEGLKESYSQCAKVVHNWLEKKIKGRDLVIDKLTDDEAKKKGDVTDIRIFSGEEIINLSIKHGHGALKHQRPPTTAQRCGCAKGSKEDIGFRKGYKVIIDNFLTLSKKLAPTARKFNDLLCLDKEFIFDHLYLPICKYVTKTINELCVGKERTQALFSFLVGTTSFYKIIDHDDKVCILDFNSIGLPDKVIARMEGKSYIYLDFSNGWELSLRLHTASSKLGNSLKFDTQPKQLPQVKEIVIPKL